MNDGRRTVIPAVEVDSRKRMDGISRSIQRMRTFVEGDYPPILMTRELDWMEKQLSDLRGLISRPQRQEDDHG